MKSFDKVPIMDREYFEQCLARATSFGVWAKLQPFTQYCVPISRPVAIEVANYHFEHGGCLLGQLSQSGRLELSLTVQWFKLLKKQLKKEKKR